MPLKLKATLLKIGMRQAELCRQITQSSGRPLTQGAMTNLLNYGQWPMKSDLEEIKRQIEDVLRCAGVSADEVAASWEVDEDDSAFHKVARPQLSVVSPESTAADFTAPPAPPATTTTTERGPQMFFRAESLRPATRKTFGLVGNPFDDLSDARDIYMWEDWRYAREALWDCAKNSAFRAIVGESGSGKTTLVQELKERIHREHHQVILIEPYVIAMEETEARGRPLRSEDIIDSTIRALDSRQSIPHRAQQRFKLAHDMLIESSRAGYKHLLFFEEAHALPVSTLKQLKRWRELRDGLRPLVGIALVGQPELKTKLDERNPNVREIVQRLEMVELLPLDDALAGYVKTRLARVDRDMASLFDPAAIDAMRERLTYRNRTGSQSICYPLAVNNLCIRALNAAADLGASRVTADIVKGA